MASRDKRPNNAPDSTTNDKTQYKAESAQTDVNSEDIAHPDVNTKDEIRSLQSDESVDKKTMLEKEAVDATDESKLGAVEVAEASTVSDDTAPTNQQQPDPSIESAKNGDNVLSEELPELPDANPDHSNVPRETPPKKNRLTMVLSLLLVPAVVGSFVYTWQLNGKLVELSKSQEAIQQQLASANSGVATLKGQLTERVAAEEASVASITDMQKQLAKVAQDSSGADQQINSQLSLLQSQFRKLAGVDREDWLLAEAEYLVKLAQSKLQLENNVTSAIGLMVEADSRLAGLNDPSLFDVRGLLAKDIARLRAIPPIDLNGIVLQINALVEQVADLPLKAVALPPLDSTAEKMGDDTAEQSTEPKWQDRLFDRLNQVADKLVKIRRIDGPVEPLLLPAEEAYLRENIKLQLHLAAVGAARGDAEVYRSSIANAIKWSGEYFKPNDSATKGLLKTLDELAQRPIQSELPTLTQSIKSIGIWVDQRIRQRLLDKSSISDNKKKGS